MVATIDAYLTTLAPGQRAVMQQARAVLGAALPTATEAISYQLPTWKIDGRAVVYFAIWKEHAALYPGASNAVAAFDDELRPYEQTKGTIRFPLDAVPFDLVRRIALYRAATVADELAARALKQTAKKKTTTTATKQTATKKTATKKAATKKAATKKAATKKTPTKKTPTKKTATKKAATKKAPTKKTATKKTSATTKKAPARRS